jgi:hypothetical protein
MLRYELVIIDEDAEDNNVIEHVVTHDAERVIYAVQSRDFKASCDEVNNNE